MRDCTGQTISESHGNGVQKDTTFRSSTTDRLFHPIQCLHSEGFRTEIHTGSMVRKAGQQWMEGMELLMPSIRTILRFSLLHHSICISAGPLTAAILSIQFLMEAVLPLLHRICWHLQ